MRGFQPNQVERRSRSGLGDEVRPGVRAASFLSPLCSLSHLSAFFILGPKPCHSKSNSVVRLEATEAASNPQAEGALLSAPSPSLDSALSASFSLDFRLNAFQDQGGTKERATAEKAAKRRASQASNSALSRSRDRAGMGGTLPLPANGKRG